MNVWIASDIHGSALYCRKLLDLMEKRGADRLVLLGDLLYHGPRNDLPEGYDPKAVFAMLNSVKDRILCVHGNCDAEVDQMVLHFPIEADFRVEELCGRRLFLTHGHHFNVDQRPSRTLLDGAGYVVYGHFHVPMRRLEDGVWYWNPGSVSIPKENSWHGCMRMTEDAVQWLDLDGNLKDGALMGGGDMTDIQTALFALRDPAYQAFQSKLIPTRPADGDRRPDAGFAEAGPGNRRNAGGRASSRSCPTAIMRRITSTAC